MIHPLPPTLVDALIGSQSSIQTKFLSGTRMDLSKDRFFLAGNSRPNPESTYRMNAESRYLFNECDTSTTGEFKFNDSRSK